MEIRPNIPSNGTLIDERDAYKSLYNQALGQAHLAYNLLEIVLSGRDISDEQNQYELQKIREFWNSVRQKDHGA